jgi:ankyrin repeat protein
MKKLNPNLTPENFYQQFSDAIIMHIYDNNSAHPLADFKPYIKKWPEQARAAVNRVIPILNHTLLEMTILQVKPDILDFLLTIPGVDVNKESLLRISGEKRTLLKYAVIKHQREIVKKLLTVPELDPNELGVNSAAIHYCAYIANDNCLDLLLADPRINVNVRVPTTPGANNGYTVLMSAATRGRTLVVEKLLAHPNIDVNLENDGFNALFYACYSGSTKIVEMLLKHKSLKIAEDTFTLAFYYAILSNSFETIKLLIEQKPEYLQQGICLYPEEGSDSLLHYALSQMPPYEACQLVQANVGEEKPATTFDSMLVSKTPDQLRAQFNITANYAYILDKSDLYYLEVEQRKLHLVFKFKSAKEAQIFNAELHPTATAKNLQEEEIAKIAKLTQYTSPNEKSYLGLKAWLEVNKRKLFMACKKGNINTVSVLANFVETLDYLVEDQNNLFSPLTIAQVNGHQDVVQLLLSKNYCTPDFAEIPLAIQEAIQPIETTVPAETVARTDNQDLPIAAPSEKRKDNVNRISPLKLFHDAIQANDFDTFANRVDTITYNATGMAVSVMNLANSDGKTAMDLIYEHERVDMFDLLVQHPALRVDTLQSLTEYDFVERFFLHCTNEETMLSLLKNPSFNSQLKDAIGNTWLHVGYRQSWKVLNELITTFQLDINERNSNGHTFFNIICLEGSINLVFQVLTQPLFFQTLEDSDVKIVLERVSAWLQLPSDQREPITFDDERRVLKWFGSIMVGTSQEPYFDLLFAALNSDEFHHAAHFTTIIKSLAKEAAISPALLFLLTNSLKRSFPELSIAFEEKAKVGKYPSSTLMSYQSQQLAEQTLNTEPVLDLEMATNDLKKMLGVGAVSM